MSIKRDLGDWLAEYSGYDIECEQEVREFLKQDKSIISEIKIEFEKGNTILIKRKIKNFLLDNDKVVRTCKVCNKKQFISLEKLDGMKCKECDEILLKKTVAKEVSNAPKKVIKKCMYCSKPVLPLENSTTCSYHRGVGFRY